MLVHSKKPNKKMARGGSVNAESLGESRAGFMAKEAASPMSPLGHSTRKLFREGAKDLHREGLSKLKSMPNPKLKGLAEGGEVQPEMPEEMNMSDMAADELMEAFHSKDKPKLVSAMKAMISACMNDEGSDD